MRETKDSKRRFAGVCGEYCVSCAPVVEGICRGCAYELARTPRGECAIFQCAVVERGFEHCGLCPDFPCELFRSSAGFERVQLRIRALQRRLEIGTDRWLEEQEGLPA